MRFVGAPPQSAQARITPFLNAEEMSRKNSRVWSREEARSTGSPSTFRLREINASGLVEIDEDLSFYEGAGDGPVAKVKVALRRISP